MYQVLIIALATLASVSVNALVECRSVSGKTEVAIYADSSGKATALRANVLDMVWVTDSIMPMLKPKYMSMSRANGVLGETNIDINARVVNADLLVGNELENTLPVVKFRSIERTMRTAGFGHITFNAELDIDLRDFETDFPGSNKMYSGIIVRCVDDYQVDDLPVIVK